MMAPGQDGRDGSEADGWAMGGIDDHDPEVQEWRRWGRRQPISEVATTAIDRNVAGRPRWEEEGITDGNMGLTGSTGSRRRRRRLVGREDGATTTTSGRTK
ncbi:hypothetical protein E2562_007023 [Oryza meyeriana var. granulata]|uniref:DUF834 domain-containing protein n=1 Tax=Oryza meyeriana var. granulata TaxID=110450 RepID=A0A6G1E8Q0_9ORYZ|nr:hypothetical protein E2562_007023 [Oryza meyeriana var. granulata]